MTKEYAESLSGFKKWCKDHPWNTHFEIDKEYYSLKAKDGEVFYTELSLNTFGEQKIAFCNLRVFDKTKMDFVLFNADKTPDDIYEKCEEKLKNYAERKNAVISL